MLLFVLFVCVLVSVAFLQAREKVWSTHISHWSSVALDKQSSENAIVFLTSFCILFSMDVEINWQKMNLNEEKDTGIMYLAPNTNPIHIPVPGIFVFAALLIGHPTPPHLIPCRFFIRVTVEEDNRHHSMGWT